MNDPVQGQDTRERLIAVAARLFASKGFDGVSVRDITGEAEANLGAVTYHFGGKGGLFAAVMERKTQPLLRMLRSVAESDRDPEQKLRDILLNTALHVLHTDSSLKAFFIECIHGGDRLPPETLGGLRERNRVVGAIIQEGIDRGTFKPCDVETATWMFFSTLIPYVLHEPLINRGDLRGTYDEAFVRNVVDTATSLFFSGLKQ